METSCQASYPLNSENASPPGTFKVYLSWADMALLLKALASAVTIAIARICLLFITSAPLSRVPALTSFAMEGGTMAHTFPLSTVGQITQQQTKRHFRVSGLEAALLALR